MVTLAPADLGVLREQVQALEEAGVDAVGIGDSPGYHDTYVALAVAAQVTERIRLGPMVTNVVTRTPQVTARALLSLDELAPGRVFAGVGSGDSALAGSRVARAPLSELRAGLATLRETLQAPEGARPVQLVVTANGPRTLALGGGVADAVVSGAGVDEGAVARARQAVESTARGRPAQEGGVPFWVMTRVAFGRDRNDAVRELLPLLASGANHVLRVPSELAGLPDGTRDRVVELLEKYDYSAHGRRHGNPNADLVERLGLAEALADRFAVAGSPADVVAGLRRLADSGVDGVVVPAIGLDVDALVHHLGREVLPALRRPVP